MIEKPEDYELFHYGVKGMKWGVRLSKNSTSGTSGTSSEGSSRKPLSDKTKTNLKTAGKVAGATAMLAGTAAVSTILAKRGMVSISDSNKFASATAMNVGAQFVKNNTDYMVLTNLVDQISGRTTQYRYRKG